MKTNSTLWRRSRFRGGKVLTFATTRVKCKIGTNLTPKSEMEGHPETQLLGLTLRVRKNLPVGGKVQGENKLNSRIHEG